MPGDLANLNTSVPALDVATGCFCRIATHQVRNRAACVSALLITLTILAGFAVSTVMYLRKNAALKEQQRLRPVRPTPPTSCQRMIAPWP